MRTLDYLRISAKDLRRSPWRSVLTVLALIISSAILVTLSTLSLNARQVIIDELSPDSSLTTIVVTPNQSVGTGGLFGNIQVASGAITKLNDQSVAAIAGLPSIRYAVPRAHIWEFNTFQIDSYDKAFVAQTEGLVSADASDLPLSDGREFTANSTAHEVVLGAAYAKALGLPPGSTGLIGKDITITTVNGYRGEGAVIPAPNATAAANELFSNTPAKLHATIVGITTAGNNQNDIFVPMGWARAAREIQHWQDGSLTITDQVAQDGYSSIVVKTDQPSQVAAAAAAINHLGYGEISTQAILKQIMSFATIMWGILGGVAVVSLIAAALGIVNTMLMVVAEQRYAIGIWRACGAPRSQIARQFLLQAVMLGCSGGTLGAAAGYATSYYVGQRVTALLQTQNLAAIQLAPSPWWLLTGTVVLASLFSAAASLYPAIRAARQDPSKTLATGQ